MQIKTMIKRSFLILLILSLSTSFYGQNDWSKLSAKQKIKIAKKEQKAAKKDPEYLKLMEEALVLFQEGNFEEAKVKYQAAHDRRPDNVYPIVMLEDIEVAINSPEEEIVEENVQEVIEEEATPIIAPVINETNVEIQEDEVEELIVEPEITESEEIILPTVAEKPTTVVKPTKQPEKETTRVQVQKEYLNDGVYKDSFKEGSANVEQIKIVKKGVETTYRKVSHSWGAIYYFKGEDSISKNEWEDLLKEIEDR